MLLRQMRYFVSIVETGSFTEAAEQNYISQSAISQQIKILEDELGVQLLERVGRKVKLTLAGEHFYRNSLGILEDVDRLTKETIQIGKYDDEHLSIAFLKNFGGQIIQKCMSKFCETYPEVTLKIQNGSHDELYELQFSNEVDLVLNDQRRMHHFDFVNYELVDSPCFVEISKSNKLSSLDYIQVEELKRLPCIIIATKQQEETEKDYYKNYLGFHGDFVVASDLESARILVAANKGFLPVSGSHFNLYDPIARIPLYKDYQQLTRKYCLFWKKEKSNYYIEEFAEMLKKCFEEG